MRHEVTYSTDSAAAIAGNGLAEASTSTPAGSVEGDGRYGSRYPTIESLASEMHRRELWSIPHRPAVPFNEQPAVGRLFEPDPAQLRLSLPVLAVAV